MFVILDTLIEILTPASIQEIAGFMVEDMYYLNTRIRNKDKIIGLLYDIPITVSAKVPNRKIKFTYWDGSNEYFDL